ncbi:MAG: AAA family ATPase [SAR324 cluster bacterium]|nr:AAA family ATPase [SAR324 cluster bacterium]
MPGQHYSQIEKKLAKTWDNSGFSDVTLKSIQIKGSPGLRGICNLDLQFNYPLTVICGRNGSGKTTFLAIAALGFHREKGHLPRGAKLSDQARVKKKTTAHLTFSDFFFKGPSDPDVSGVKITWNYLKKKSLSIQKRSEKWMHYERRPSRAVHYLGISRTLPAIEQSVLRSHFTAKKRPQGVPLNDQFRKRLGEIMGRQYQTADALSSKAYSIRTCSTSANYSSFNMGAGEDILIDLLGTLQSTPENSLIVIEEIELGLHPAALSCLAKHLQEIIYEKNFQIIISTHSSDFLDAVPDRARVLIKAGMLEHNIIYSPTTRYAMGTLRGGTEPELFVYCEDEVAIEIIQRSMTATQMKRVKILPVGTKDELARQAVYHLKAELPQKHFILWDGDVPHSEANSWIKKYSNNSQDIIDKLCFGFIGKSSPPENILVEILNCEEGFEIVKTEMRLESISDASEIITALNFLSEHHEIPYSLAKQLNITKEDALKKLVDCSYRTDNQLFEDIQNSIENVLNGNVVSGPQYSFL